MESDSEKHLAHALALHGFTGCGNDFDGLRHFFPDIFFDTPDLHGDDVSESFPALLERLAKRFHSLPESHPRILLGYSMGGRIALHLALLLSRRNAFRPSDRLVLISASPGLKTESERAARREDDAALAEKILAAPSAEAFYAFWQTVPIISSQRRIPEPWKSRITSKRAAANKGNWAKSLATLGTGTLPSLWNELEKISCETLLICGENDKKFSRIAEQMHERLPRSRLVKIPSCGHAPHLESPASFPLRNVLRQGNTERREQAQDTQRDFNDKT